MKTSDRGRKLIEQWEEGGTPKLTPYDDGTGTLTIGFGHTSAAGPPIVSRGMTITAEQADQIFSSDLEKVETSVNTLVKVPVTQNQFDALVSFQFNTGGLARSSLLRLVNSQAPAESIRSAFMAWTKAHVGGQLVTMPGLVNRRRIEANLFMEGYTPVTTTTTTTVTGTPIKLDFTKIEATIETATHLWPFLSAFVPEPARSAVSVGITVVEEALKAAEDLQSAFASGGNVQQVVAQHLRRVADQLDPPK